MAKLMAVVPVVRSGGLSLCSALAIPLAFASVSIGLRWALDYVVL